MGVSSGPVFLSKKRRIGSSQLRVNLPQKKKEKRSGRRGGTSKIDRGRETSKVG